MFFTSTSDISTMRSPIRLTATGVEIRERVATDCGMPQVQTVRGPIDTAELGRTYMHEHVFVLTPDVQQNYPDEWGDDDRRVADAVAKLSELAASGVRTIVDPTVI